MRVWTKHPDVGGTKVPQAAQDRTRRRILAYAQANFAGQYVRIDVRFRSQFCYIDAYVEPSLPEGYPPPDSGMTREERLAFMRETPLHLCRLRYFGNEDAWSFAFYKYSDEKYELCYLPNGTFYGTPEEAFECSGIYLRD